MSLRRVLNIIGRLLVAAGLLLLLFTVYQLWGTGLLEARSQSALRAQFTHELPPGALGRAASAATGHDPYVVGDQTAPERPPPAEGQPVGVIDIPKIAVDQVVVQGVGTADLEMGPGHYPGTPLPGERGNAAIAGHRTTYGHPFYDLNELSAGDRIVVTTTQGIFLYRVTAVFSVLPWQNDVLAPTNKALLTLTTCTPRYSAAQRLVARAVLARSLIFSQQHHLRAVSLPKETRPVATDLAGAASNSWPAAVGWGLLTLAAALGTCLLARRSRHRLIVYSAGGVVVLVVLFVFFTALSPLLPASF
jgi:sortase A